MPTMVKVVCAYCGTEYEKELKRFNEAERKGSRHFCSQECKNAIKRNGEERPCGYCGKMVYRTKSELEKSKSGEVFCNKSCSTAFNNQFKSGENHVAYTNGVGSYRSKALRVQEHICSVCGWSEDERILEVHHIDEDRTNNDISNLIVLCPTCHRKITLGYYKLEENKLVKLD